MSCMRVRYADSMYGVDGGGAYESMRRRGCNMQHAADSMLPNGYARRTTARAAAARGRKCAAAQRTAAATAHDAAD